MSPVLAIALAAALSATAWWARALTPGGAFAATVVGTTILGTTGWAGAIVLGTFFLSSTLIGRILPDRSQAETRTALQVIANGGAAALGSLLALISPALAVWTVTASLAAATADTWATSVGARSSAHPVRFGTRRRVPPGTSGGVTWLGTAGAATGALLVSWVGAWAIGSLPLGVAGSLIGVGGMFLDSFLGARFQGRFRCPGCGTSTERRRHECGAKTISDRGWAWLDNDGVNLLTTTTAALAGAAAWVLR